MHHDGPREALPRIDGLLRTVVRLHSAGEPHLHRVKRVFDERWRTWRRTSPARSASFPACLAWEQSGTPVDAPVISAHEHEHATLGDALAELRGLCHDHDRAAALCNTHRALLDALEVSERDLHRHVDEENNILMPRVRGPQRPEAATLAPLASRHRPAATPSEPSDAMLPRSEAWIAEQTHRRVTVVARDGVGSAVEAGVGFNP